MPMLLSSLAICGPGSRQYLCFSEEETEAQGDAHSAETMSPARSQLPSSRGAHLLKGWKVVSE